MKIRYLNESKYNSLLREFYEDDNDLEDSDGIYNDYEDEVNYVDDEQEPDDKEFSTYQGETINDITFKKIYWKEYSEYINDDDEDCEVSKEEYEDYQKNWRDPKYENISIDVKYRILSCDTADSRYSNIDEDYDECDIENGGDFSGEVIDDILNIDKYLKYPGYTQNQDGSYTIDYAPSLDMNDIDSVNRYLEHEYGIDNSNPLYILTDGIGLDSSTRYGTRGRDHHLTNDKDSYTLTYLLKNGAIRCMPESPGMSISKEPNQAQSGSLLRWLRKYQGDTFYLDLVDKDGDYTIASAVFDNMRPQAVLAQLYAYFRDGIKPRGTQY